MLVFKAKRRQSKSLKRWLAAAKLVTDDEHVLHGDGQRSLIAPVHYDNDFRDYFTQTGELHEFGGDPAAEHGYGDGVPGGDGGTTNAAGSSAIPAATGVGLAQACGLDLNPSFVRGILNIAFDIAGGLASSSVVGLSFDAGMDAMVADLRLLTTYDSRVKLTLQYSSNPAANWSLLSTRTGTGAWTGITPYINTALAGGRTRFVFDGGFAPAIFRKTFFRLKAEELP